MIRRSTRSRRGLVLVIVMIVVAVLALAGYTFSELMIRQKEAVILHGRQIQAQALVESGVEITRQFLAQDQATLDQAGGIYNNAYQFQGITVVDDVDPAARGKFTVISPGLDEQGNPLGVRYGLEDESTRLNINAIPVFEKLQAGTGEKILLALPGMTEEIAAAILDWMDEDEEERTNGAESIYYSQLQPPYLPRNGQLETIEELLLVRGVTPELLFGADFNRNFVMDQGEMASQQAFVGVSSAATGSDHALDRGWSAYLTLFSQERNVNPQGMQRINLNHQNLEELAEQLSAVFNQEWTNFILAYRQNGPQSMQSGDPQSPTAGEIDLSLPGQTTLGQVLDLIGAQTQVRFKGRNETVAITCPFPSDPLAMATYLPLLMDNVTVGTTATIPGRININLAPQVILKGIPGMTDAILEKLLSQRQAAAENPDLVAAHRHETWLLTEGVVTLSEMKSLMPFVTGGGHRYRAQVVGYFQSGGGVSRAEVVFDASESRPRILFWRDLSHLGRGFPLETLGMDLAVGL